MTLASLEGSHLLLDSNMIVLYCVGRVRRELVGEHRRTREYSEDDWNSLSSIIDVSRSISISSYSVAEASNLAENASHSIVVLDSLAKFVKRAEEVHTPVREAVEHSAFLRLGATDCALLCELAKNSSLLLMTKDLKLSLEAARLGLQVVNFAHLQERNL